MSVIYSKLNSTTGKRELWEKKSGKTDTKCVIVNESGTEISLNDKDVYRVTASNGVQTIKRDKRTDADETVNVKSGIDNSILIGQVIQAEAEDEPEDEEE